MQTHIETLCAYAFIVRQPDTISNHNQFSEDKIPEADSKFGILTAAFSPHQGIIIQLTHTHPTMSSSSPPDIPPLSHLLQNPPNTPLKIAAALVEHTPFLQTLPLYLEPFSKPVYGYVKYLSETLALGDEQTTLFMLCLWSSFVFMILARWVPAGVMRQFYTLVLGLTMTFLNFGVGGFHSVSCVLFGYGIMVLSQLAYSVLGEKGGNYRSASTVVRYLSMLLYVTMFVHLTFVHWYRMTIDYLGWSLDFSLIQMLLVLKIVSIQMNFNDGVRALALRKEKKDPLKHMFPLHVDYSIDTIPSPLMYLSFMYFFPVLLSGPVVEFTDYQKWVQSYRLPLDLKEAGKNLLWGFFNIAIFVFVGPKFAMRHSIMRPYIESAPLHQIILRSVICAFCLRTKYFVSWYFAQANCVIGGFGAVTHPKTGRIVWSGIDQARFWKVELCTSIRDVATNWNANVSRWLRLYVYTRVSDLSNGKSGTMLNMLSTFIVSAIWHGLYLNYYIMWVSLVVLSEIHRVFFKKVTRRIFTEDEWKGKKYTFRVLVWDFFCIILTHVTLAYFTTSFQLLSVEESFAYFRRFSWVGHILTVIVAVVVFTMPPVRMSREVVSGKSKKVE